MPEGFAPAYKSVFELAGPVIRYRILRDLAHRDDSFLETLGLRQEVEKLPRARAILSQGLPDSANEFVAAEENILTLCELGLGDHDAVAQCAENLLPGISPSTAHEPHLYRLSRDRLLRFLIRAGFGGRPQVRQAILDVIREWGDFLRDAGKAGLFVEDGGALRPREGVLLPTISAYDAICFHQWHPEDKMVVVETVSEFLAWAEGNPWPEHLLAEEPYREQIFRILNKQEYLSRPERMLYELELAGRLGIAGKTTATRWMLEELEARQDGDGFFRFDFEGSSALPWYFPLDGDPASDDYTVEWTFRGLLVFGLLGYDL
jgi:hypothetical protein